MTLLTWHQVKCYYLKASSLLPLKAASASPQSLKEMQNLRPTWNYWVGTRSAFEQCPSTPPTPRKLAYTLKFEKPCSSSSHLVFSFDPLPYRVFSPGQVILCTGQVGKWLFYKENNMFITCPRCYFLLLTLYPSMPSLSRQVRWPDSEQTKDFHLSVMIPTLFTRAQRKEKAMLAAPTQPCQFVSPLLPSEIRAINTRGESKESPLVLFSICKIITETFPLLTANVLALNRHTPIQRSELLQIRNGCLSIPKNCLITSVVCLEKHVSWIMVDDVRFM